jgi:hypothetical protein
METWVVHNPTKSTSSNGREGKVTVKDTGPGIYHFPAMQP